MYGKMLYMIPATHGYARLRPEPGQAVSGRKRVPTFFPEKNMAA